MKRKELFTIILVILSTLLLYSNTELLLRFTESRSALTIASRVLFAGAFSSITVILIAIYPEKTIIILSGLLDGAALFLEFFPFSDSHTAIMLTSVYFSLYGSYIVIVSGIYSHSAGKEDEKAAQAKKISLEQLKDERKRIQNRINATKNEEKKAELIAQKREIEKKIGQLVAI